jgi:hypothetical protein
VSKRDDVYPPHCACDQYCCSCASRVQRLRGSSGLVCAACLLSTFHLNDILHAQSGEATGIGGRKTAAASVRLEATNTNDSSLNGFERVDAPQSNVVLG